MSRTHYEVFALPKCCAKVGRCCSVYELPHLVNSEPAGRARRSEEAYGQQGTS